MASTTMPWSSTGTPVTTAPLTRSSFLVTARGSRVLDGDGGSRLDEDAGDQVDGVLGSRGHDDVGGIGTMPVGVQHQRASAVRSSIVPAGVAEVGGALCRSRSMQRRQVSVGNRLGSIRPGRRSKRASGGWDRGRTSRPAPPAAGVGAGGEGHRARRGCGADDAAAAGSAFDQALVLSRA